MTAASPIRDRSYDGALLSAEPDRPPRRTSCTCAPIRTGRDRSYQPCLTAPGDSAPKQANTRSGVSLGPSREVNRRTTGAIWRQAPSQSFRCRRQSRVLCRGTRYTPLAALVTTSCTMGASADDCSIAAEIASVNDESASSRCVRILSNVMVKI